MQKFKKKFFSLKDFIQTVRLLFTASISAHGVLKQPDNFDEI